MNPFKKVSHIDAMNMNRAARRAIGKLNKTKIPGATKPIIKPKKTQ